ncbi:MAG: hypothetical protein QW806_09840 [Nitrososphaerota archaeon]
MGLFDYIKELENRYNKSFDYTKLTDLYSLGDDNLIKLILPIFFLDIEEDKNNILEKIEKEYCKFLGKNISLKFVRDYKVFNLFLLVYLFKNFKSSSNLHEIIQEIENNLSKIEEEEKLVTIDNILSIVTKK